MTKGRNTTVIGLRVPDEVYFTIKAYANKRGLSISDWIKPIVLRALFVGKPFKRNDSCYGCPDYSSICFKYGCQHNPNAYKHQKNKPVMPCDKTPTAHKPPKISWLAKNVPARKKDR